MAAEGEEREVFFGARVERGLPGAIQFSQREGSGLPRDLRKKLASAFTKARLHWDHSVLLTERLGVSPRLKKK